MPCYINNFLFSYNAHLELNTSSAYYKHLWCFTANLKAKTVMVNQQISISFGKMAVNYLLISENAQISISDSVLFNGKIFILKQEDFDNIYWTWSDASMMKYIDEHDYIKGMEFVNTPLNECLVLYSKNYGNNLDMNVIIDDTDFTDNLLETPIILTPDIAPIEQNEYATQEFQATNDLSIIESQLIENITEPEITEEEIAIFSEIIDQVHQELSLESVNQLDIDITRVENIATITQILENNELEENYEAYFDKYISLLTENIEDDNNIEDNCHYSDFDQLQNSITEFDVISTNQEEYPITIIPQIVNF